MISDELHSMQDKLNKVEATVDKIYSVLIGNEFNKEDSMQSKIRILEEKVHDLEVKDLKREAKQAIYMAITGFLGTAAGALLVAWLTTFIKK